MCQCFPGQNIRRCRICTAMTKYPVWLIGGHTKAVFIGFKREASSFHGRIFFLVPQSVIWVNFALIKNSESFPDEETAVTKL